MGNKCDLTENQEVTLEEAHAYAKMINADIIKETSARDNNGIDELFQEIGEKLYKRHKDKENEVS